MATDFNVNYCCSSCGEMHYGHELTLLHNMYSIHKLAQEKCLHYSDISSAVTSAKSVNTRLSATATQVKVTAVASCSHMLILQQGPHTQRGAHTHKAQGVH